MLKVVSEQILRLAKRVIKKLTKQQVDMDGMQFGFTQGCITVTTYCFYFETDKEEICTKKEESVLCMQVSGERFLSNH